MAERVGFEPTVEFPLHTLSKRAPSTTRTSLRFRINDLRAVANSLAQDPRSRIFHSTSRLASPDVRGPTVQPECPAMENHDKPHPEAPNAMHASIVGFWGVRYQVRDVQRAITFYTQTL